MHLILPQSMASLPGTLDTWEVAAKAGSCSAVGEESKEAEDQADLPP